MAARNLSPHVALYGSSRFILNALRGVSELVFALIFVSAVGLGPFPGILALALHNAGMLGKFYAEAIEAIDPGPVEALQASGARWTQVVVYAILPQVVPALRDLQPVSPRGQHPLGDRARPGRRRRQSAST